MANRVDKIEHIKPGSLCLDNNRLCVLVKLGAPEDSPATRLMNQAGILQPYGWFLDLDNPNVRFESVGYIYSGNDISKCWIADLFSRNLDVVEWIKEI